MKREFVVPIASVVLGRHNHEFTGQPLNATLGIATMARRKKNKSDAIRAALTELGPEARNRDVIEKLAGEKVKVSAQMVSTVRKRMGGAPSSNGHRRPGRPSKKAAAGSVTLTALLAAKELVAATGSVAEAKSTLEVLGKLQ